MVNKGGETFQGVPSCFLLSKYSSVFSRLHLFETMVIWPSFSLINKIQNYFWHLYKEYLCSIQSFLIVTDFCIIFFSFSATQKFYSISFSICPSHRKSYPQIVASKSRGDKPRTYSSSRSDNKTITQSICCQITLIKYICIHLTSNYQAM